MQPAAIDDPQGAAGHSDATEDLAGSPTLSDPPLISSVGFEQPQRRSSPSMLLFEPVSDSVPGPSREREPGPEIWPEKIVARGLAPMLSMVPLPMTTLPAPDSAPTVAPNPAALAISIVAPAATP